MANKKLTVNNILHADNIADLIQDIYEKRAEIDQFILIYTDQEAVPHAYWDGTKERIVFALEEAKLQILQGEADAE